MSVSGTPALARRGTVASISSQITNKRATQTHSASAVEESLRTFKLLEALRAGDHTTLASLVTASNHPIPSASISISRPASPIASNTHADPSRAQSTPLHLAVQCASASTVEFLLSLNTLDVNQRDASGNTALHLAAKSNRADVVRLLLNDESVNDATINNDGKRAAEVCLRGGEVERMLEEHRASFISSHTPLLHKYAAESNLVALEKLFAEPRVAALLGINHQDPVTGSTILHEAARNRDIDLVQWCLDRGADVLIRDRKGKLPAEVSKDERIKSLLKEALNGDTEEVYRAKRRWARVLPTLQSRGTIVTTGAGVPRRLLNAAPTSVLIPAAPGTAPTMQGYLSKWTNYAGGFKSRWFVLDEHGMLAYYKNQDDANNACRGSINMKYAKIWIDASDKNRFDVIGKGTNRYHLKTEHPVEAKRWIFALSQSKQWIIDLEKGLVNSKGRTSIILDDSHRPQFLTDEDNGSNISAEAKPPVAGRRRASSKVSMTDSIVAARNSTAGLPRGRSHLEPLRNSEDEEDELFESQTEPPLGDEYRTNVNLVLKQVDLQEQLLESLLILTGDGSSGSGQGVAHATKQVMLVDAFRTSLKSLRGLVDEVLDMSEDRETFWRRKFEAEAERRRLWEESMHSLALEQQEMERFVQVVVQERKARRKEKRKKTAEVERGMGGGESEIIIMEEEQEVAQAIPQHRSEDEFGVETDVDGKSESKVMLTEEPEVAAAEEEKGVVEDKKKSVDDKKKAEEFALDEGDLDEEEFFDAISDDEEGPAVPDMSLLSSIAATTTVLPAPENLPDSASVGDNTSVEDMSTTDSGAPSEIASTSNTVATTVQPSPQFTQFTASTSTSSPSQLVPELQVSAVGYPKELRASLPIADNEKPTVSLWSILKNSIGKDLTRITLPVYFNEPTSMLQRMCEDIEYSELLDTAVHQPSSAERMMYVVAFAVSNFSSVPGRVAKPFNPLLGETFEYVREDKGYRYVSEQVSHHPPISACHCESSNYKFYAESDIRNKFWGRSFELHPKGVSHVELKVPNAVIPGAEDPEGRTVEHYSYKKPIVAVTNLITGNPTFDMYGDMEFTNHRTRDTCVLTFKARGWRSKDANEFRGFVTSGETGEKVWEIAGRWNERMLARRVKAIGSGGSTSTLEEDLGSDNAAAAARPQHEDGSTQQKGRNIILLWKRHPFPTTKVPYNLTDFAMTLNHLPEPLQEYIAPTDSRLRPDQRAMEVGEYEVASNEKTRLEEKQRTKRKMREASEGQHAEWQPRWFKRTIERDTQEGVWEFNDEYWGERERVRKNRDEAQDAAAVKWNINDDDIF